MKEIMTVGQWRLKHGKAKEDVSVADKIVDFTIRMIKLQTKYYLENLLFEARWGNFKD